MAKAARSLRAGTCRLARSPRSEKANISDVGTICAGGFDRQNADGARDDTHLFLEGERVGDSGVLDLAAGGGVLFGLLLLLVVVLRDLSFIKYGRQDQTDTEGSQPQQTGTKRKDVGYVSSVIVYCAIPPFV